MEKHRRIIAEAAILVAVAVLLTTVIAVAPTTGSPSPAGHNHQAVIAHDDERYLTYAETGAFDSNPARASFYLQ